MIRVKRAARMLAVYLLSILFALRAILHSPLRLLRRILRERARGLWTGVPMLTLPLNAKVERLLGAKARSLAVTTYHVTGAFDYDRAPEHLAELGRRGREYVEKYFSVEAVTERLGRAYRELGATP